MHPVMLSIPQFVLFGHVLGPFHIFSYGVFLAISFLCGLGILMRDGKNAGLKSEEMMDLTIWVIVASIIGARIMYVILSPSEYSNDPLGTLMIHKGGLSFHGGAIGGTIAAFAFAARKKIPGLRLADSMVCPLIIGSATARIGCFLNGCCYGAPWDGPLGVVFPVLRDGVHRHPTQFYDLFLHLILFGIITYATKFKKRDGDLVSFYLVGFAILRFTVEIFRKGATGRVFLLDITMAQWASFAIIAVGVILYYLPRKQYPPLGQSEAAAASGPSAPSGKKKNQKKKKKK